MKTLLLPSPITDITPLPHSTASEMLCTATRASRSETGAAWHWTGWLLARAGYVSPCCNVMCLWYMCFCAEVFFFFCSQTVLQMEHSLGVKKFFSSSLSSCKKLYFLNTLSPVLSTPLSYVCCVCMDRLMANFAGTCTSDNKGLLLLLLLLNLSYKLDFSAQPYPGVAGIPKLLQEHNDDSTWRS